MKTANIIKDQNFKKLSKRSVRPDSRKRVVLPLSVNDDISFDIYRNKVGQIILDPKKEIPASQAWFWENPQNIKDFEESIADIKAGRVYRMEQEELED